MTHHVECVAILEPAGEGRLTCGFVLFLGVADALDLFPAVHDVEHAGGPGEGLTCCFVSVVREGGRVVPAPRGVRETS